MEKFKKLSRAEMKNVRGGDDSGGLKCGSYCGATVLVCPTSCPCGIIVSGPHMGGESCGANNGTT